MIRLGVALDTTIRVGLVDDQAVRVLHEEPMPADDEPDGVLDRICALIDRLPIVEAASIGLSVPDADTSVDDPGGAGATLGPALADRYDIPAFVQRAAHCFALAEARYGAGRGQSPVVGLRVDRRLEGGIVADGRLLTGHTGAAGRIGRASYRDGTYDDYCGGRFLERHHGTPATEVIDQAEAGKDAAIALFSEMGTHLGRALRSLSCLVDPACIVLGGDIVRAHPFFEDAMRQAMTREGGPAVLDDLSLNQSGLRHVEVLGAAALGATQEEADIASY